MFSKQYENIRGAKKKKKRVPKYFIIVTFSVFENRLRNIRTENGKRYASESFTCRWGRVISTVMIICREHKYIKYMRKAYSQSTLTLIRLLTDGGTELVAMHR